jgi:hypothetical protein
MAKTIAERFPSYVRREGETADEYMTRVSKAKRARVKKREQRKKVKEEKVRVLKHGALTDEKEEERRLTIEATERELDEFIEIEHLKALGYTAEEIDFADKWTSRYGCPPPHFEPGELDLPPDLDVSTVNMRNFSDLRRHKLTELLCGTQVAGNDHGSGLRRGGGKPLRLYPLSTTAILPLPGCPTTLTSGNHSEKRIVEVSRVGDGTELENQSKSELKPCNQVKSEHTCSAISSPTCRNTATIDSSRPRARTYNKVSAMPDVVITEVLGTVQLPPPPENLSQSRNACGGNGVESATCDDPEVEIGSENDAAQENVDDRVEDPSKTLTHCVAIEWSVLAAIFRGRRAADPLSNAVVLHLSADIDQDLWFRTYVALAQRDLGDTFEPCRGVRAMVEVIERLEASGRNWRGFVSELSEADPVREMLPVVTPRDVLSWQQFVLEQVKAGKFLVVVK